MHEELYAKAADEAEIKVRAREDKAAIAKATQETKRRKTQSEYEILLKLL